MENEHADYICEAEPECCSEDEAGHRRKRKARRRAYRGFLEYENGLEEEKDGRTEI